MKKVLQYIKLMRPHHYLKNLLIFLPLIFSRNLFDTKLLTKTIIGLIAFSLMASVIYTLNDIMDVEADRKNIKKCKRPIASGKISIKAATIFAIILLIISLILHFIVHPNIIADVIFFGYLILNILYSIKLKHIPIIDIVILALSFLLRVWYGATITGIEISNWLYLTILSFSFYMGLGKRRNELKKNGDKSRRVLQYYNHEFLSSNMYVCMTLGIVFYSLWCININITNIIWTVPLVIIICMKYSLNIEGNSYGDPIDVILHDKYLELLAIIFAISMFILMYL